VLLGEKEGLFERRIKCCADERVMSVTWVTSNVREAPRSHACCNIALTPTTGFLSVNAYGSTSEGGSAGIGGNKGIGHQRVDHDLCAPAVLELLEKPCLPWKSE
jgi:hypothetical protein